MNLIPVKSHFIYPFFICNVLIAGSPKFSSKTMVLFHLGRGLSTLRTSNPNAGNCCSISSVRADCFWRGLHCKTISWNYGNKFPLLDKHFDNFPFSGHLCTFSCPTYFNLTENFKEWFSNPLTGMVEDSQEYNDGLVRRLHKVLRPFLLRRMKNEVEKQVTLHFISFSCWSVFSLSSSLHPVL